MAYKILHVEDEDAAREQVRGILTAEGYRVDSTGDGLGAMNALMASVYDLVLLDSSLPGVNGLEVLKFLKMHYPGLAVVMVIGKGDSELGVECMREGAFHYISKPLMADELLQVASRAIEHHQLMRERQVLKSTVERLGGGMNLVGGSEAFKRIVELAQRVAISDSAILIQGASGTGKEALAQHIHSHSRRADKPFVVFNCTAGPDSLLEDQLFGREVEGTEQEVALTQGQIELAHGGTLLLDEVGDLSPALQRKLLRFLQSGEFLRTGSTRVRRSDVRIISTTNKDLREAADVGGFREDLLYRLNAVSIVIPPLKEHKEDIPVIANNYMKTHLQGGRKKVLSLEATELLQYYDWPGNVRELENVLQSAALIAEGDMIEPHHMLLPPNFSTQVVLLKNAQRIPVPHLSLKQLERIHIADVLRESHWDKKVAAAILGISLKTLYTKISQYRITPS